MKATGIVRRIDDLGRVVIPKEIRRTMRIREGDPLEIYTDREGEVIFKKYSPIGELTAFASQYAETLHRTCGLSVVICDRDAVVAVSGVPKKDYADKPVSEELGKLMESRSLYLHPQEKEWLPVTADDGDYKIHCAMPIVSDGDIVGCVASLRNPNEPENRTSQPELDVETKLILTAAGFLGRQLEG